MLPQVKPAEQETFGCGRPLRDDADTILAEQSDQESTENLAADDDTNLVAEGDGNHEEDEPYTLMEPTHLGTGRVAAGVYVQQYGALQRTRCGWHTCLHPVPHPEV